MARNFLVYFDNLGFEAVFDLGQIQSDATMAALKDEHYSMPFNMNALLLRARFNTQRFPEIWVFEVSDEVSEEDVRNMAAENPQALADFARANGKNFYGRTNSSGREPVIR
jgi:hypothetical protein